MTDYVSKMKARLMKDAVILGKPCKTGKIFHTQLTSMNTHIVVYRDEYVCDVSSPFFIEHFQLIDEHVTNNRRYFTLQHPIHKNQIEVLRQDDDGIIHRMGVFHKRATTHLDIHKLINLMNEMEPIIPVNN